MLEGTYGCKGGGLAAGDVVHGDAAELVQRALGPAVADAPGAVEAAVVVLEVQGGGPVVGLVLGVGARGAGREGGEVVAVDGHVHPEGVAADDLVHVRRVLHAREDERVGALDDELGAGEAEHVLAEGLGGQEGCQGSDDAKESHGFEKRKRERESVSEGKSLMKQSRQEGTWERRGALFRKVSSLERGVRWAGASKTLYTYPGGHSNIVLILQRGLCEVSPKPRLFS